MDINIRAKMRVLYKNDNRGWRVGEIMKGNAEISELGLFLPIIPKDAQAEEEIHWAEIKNIFFDAFKIEDWAKDYHDYFMSKKDYIKFIESDDFNRQLENAYVSDGEYGYYPITKFTKNWLEKQPFDFVVRGD